MKKTILRITAAVLFLAGAALLLMPRMEGIFFQQEKEQRIREFQKRALSGGEEQPSGAEKEQSSSIEKEQPAPKETAEPSKEPREAPSSSGQRHSTGYRALWSEMQAYNRRIFEEQQQFLKDAWSYEQNDLAGSFHSAGIYDDMAGYLTVDALGICLPLYIGATQEHMRTGGVVLGQTSMPVGGENTNCVIAAHRGTIHGDAMFRDIEVLKPGDRVVINNLWETLTYEVIRCIVISPEEVDKVKIVPGLDLVTLITCHPYGNNYQRYVTYCARTWPDISERETEKETGRVSPAAAADMLPFEGMEYESSVPQIEAEDRLEAGGYYFLGVLLLTLCFLWIKGKKKEKQL